jgi:hypothetical protein
VSFVNSSLRQREWDHANSEKQKDEDRTSKKMRFDGKAILLFSFLFHPPEAAFWKCRFTQKPGKSQDLFKNLREKDGDKRPVTGKHR